jgi:hypothetical protein
VLFVLLAVVLLENVRRGAQHASSRPATTPQQTGR